MSKVVISGISTISSAGTTLKQVKEKMQRGLSSISEIKYFDTKSFMGKMAGNLTSDTWREVMDIAHSHQIDLNSALAILSIKQLMQNFNPESKDVGLSLGTCNGGINSLSEFYDTHEEKYLANYPVYCQAKDISRYFHFTGRKFLFNSACSASGLAIAYGAQMISDGKAEVVITGGSDPMSKWVYAGFNSLKTFNPSNCEPYGGNYGLNLGEAATYFVLEDMDRAKKMNHKIFAQVMGYGTSNDAYHPTAPDKDGAGISRAISAALKNSGITAGDVTYIDSHGTGTRANDVAEFAGIKKIFGSNLPFISSMKGYVGHNLGAAASTELALSLIGLQEGIIFPNHEFSKYRPGCEDEHILKNPVRVSDDVILINNNAAFGGHNVAAVFKTNVGGHYTTDSFTEKESIPVFINGIGTASLSKAKSAQSAISFTDKNVLKEYDKSLYQRRMNALTQTSIIASDLALKDMDTMPGTCGLVYGTPFGSMPSTEKYIDSIFDGGFDKASGIYFPDLVLNSTAGRVCHALQLKDYSVSISSGGDEDLKCLEIAFQAIRDKLANTLVVSAGHESDDIADQITKKHYDTHSSSLVLSNHPSKGSIRVEDVVSKTFSGMSELVLEIKKYSQAHATILVQNNSGEIEQDDLQEELNESFPSTVTNNDLFADSSFYELMLHTNSTQNITLVGISQINEVVIANLKKYEEM